ncbi:MAG: outer-membrane lipoprotein carrier protein LolA [Paludibacteraceae bacterium]|nr:outer-membrane lipoprotein carrier protein LolA [Paludibacteraceae bacterium]
MKKGILCLLLVLTAGVLSAQTDEAAVKLLTKVSSVYKNSTGTELKIKITIDDSKTNLHQSAAGLLKTQGRKFMLQSDMATLIFDGKDLYSYNKQSNEVTISQPEDEELDEVDPTSIMNQYKTGYKIDKPENQTIGNRPVSVIKLYPEDRSQEFFKVEIYIYTDNYQPYKIITYSKNGVQNTITIEKSTLNQKFAADTFVFDAKKYPNVQIIDIR